MSDIQRPIPAIITIYIMAYLFTLILCFKGEVDILSVEIMLMHIFGGLGLFLLIRKVVQRKRAGIAVFTSLLATKL